MDPKTKRIDPGNPSECERLIERGHVALIAIASEAHAARVHAQKAELEVALSEARSGDANMLRSWLANYRGISESPVVESKPHEVNVITFPSNLAAERGQSSIPQRELAHANASSPVIETPVAPTTEVPFEPTLDWDRLVPAARDRLEGRLKNQPSSELEATSERAAQYTRVSTAAVAELENDALVSNETVVESLHAAVPEDRLCSDEVAEDYAADEVTEDDLGCDEDEPLVYQELPELRVLAEVQRDLDKPLYRSGTRGLIVSVVTHVALLVTLMAITMRIPAPPASLGFDAGAVEGSAESFEVLQPIELTSPEEVSPEMPSETSESSVSLPSAVGLASTSAVAAGSNATSGMSGVQASANRAVAAGSGRPNPSSANASFFGAAASGNCFCYVIDGSESMRGGPWEAAKAELLRSLSTMKDNNRFYIIFFNQKLSAISMPGEREPATSPLYATVENLKHARTWIESLRIERGAPPNDALLHAIELEPDAIYLLADGATKIDVPAFLREKNRTSDLISGEQVRVPIHAIAFYSPDAGQKLMKQVAVENKGQFIYVPDPRKR